MVFSPSPSSADPTLVSLLATASLEACLATSPGGSEDTPSAEGIRGGKSPVSFLDCLETHTQRY